MICPLNPVGTSTGATHSFVIPRPQSSASPQAGLVIRGFTVSQDALRAQALPRVAVPMAYRIIVAPVLISIKDGRSTAAPTA
jgi:hypothetical protein